MLGLIRLALAGMVVVNHLWLPFANRVGAHAVIGFYMISGYLMARILNGRYEAGVAGTSRFLLNRFLRIFPAYWAVLALTLLGVWLHPKAFCCYSTLIAMPSSASEWIGNITLWNLTWQGTIGVPPAWSLSVEFFMYAAMGLGLARGRVATVIWFCSSLAFTVALMMVGASFPDRYYPVYAASLFFSAGAMVFHFWGAMSKLSLGRRTGLALLGLYIVFPLLVESLGGDRLTLGYYGAALLFVPVMRWAVSDKGMGWMGLAGDLAYPVFLTHFLALGMFNWLLHGFGIGNPHVIFFVLCIITGVLSVALHFGVERQVNRIRDMVRGGAASSSGVESAIGADGELAPWLEGIREYLEERYRGVFDAAAVEFHLKSHVGFGFADGILPHVLKHSSGGERLLDIGSGFGAFVIWARRAGLDAYGVEIEGFEVDCARKRLSGESAGAAPEKVFVAGDGRSLPFADASFDFITLWNVLEHVPDERGLLKEASRVLKSGGRIFMICPNYAAFRREAHYQTPWVPLMPRRLARAYLKWMGKEPSFFESSIFYRTNWGVLSAVKGLKLEAFDLWGDDVRVSEMDMSMIEGRLLAPESIKTPWIGYLVKVVSVLRLNVAAAKAVRASPPLLLVKPRMARLFAWCRMRNPFKHSTTLVAVKR